MSFYFPASASKMMCPSHQSQGIDPNFGTLMFKVHEIHRGTQISLQTNGKSCQTSEKRTL